MAVIRRKLVIVGDQDADKTELLVVFSKDDFPEVYVPTVFENYTVDVDVDGQNVELALWDTAGQHDYARLRPLSYPDTDVILICFSIGSTGDSEKSVTNWSAEVRHYCPGIPILLVDNNKHLRDNNNGDSISTPTVGAEYGQALAEKIGAICYMECSSKTKEGVNDVFQAAARASLDVKRKKKKSCVVM